MATNRQCLVLLLLAVVIHAASAAVYTFDTCEKTRNANLPFCDSSLSIDARVQDFIGRLTLNEKINLYPMHQDAISETVELDFYDWWNEALHGLSGVDYPPDTAPWENSGGSPPADPSPLDVSTRGATYVPPTESSTVFPQVINLASSFNKDLFLAVANVAGNEGRAFYNSKNSGVTYWAPNINIYRDPRWGRGQETPGEDPKLAAIYGRLYVRGLQGEDPNFIKASACCKHFAAHSVEEGRGGFNSVVTEQDLADTYLPAFKTCVVEANVSCVMTAYSGINGIPMAAHRAMVMDTLRGEWGFDGYIVTDCGAVGNLHTQHHYAANESDAVRIVLESGTDLACQDKDYMHQHLRSALDQGLVTEQLLDTALLRAYKVLFRAGYFEKEATRPFKELQAGEVDTDASKQLALDAARQSIVLLKNAPSVAKAGAAPPLPIDADSFRAKRASMALIGPYVNASYVFLGNYFGRPSEISRPLVEIGRYVPDLEYELGCDWQPPYTCSRIQEAVDLAASSQQVVLFVGINKFHEDEGRDRQHLQLVGEQDELIRRVLAVAREPVIMFVVSGGAVDLSEWKNDPRVGAIIWAGYLGQAGGRAMADVMFGGYNPSGRLTQTFYDGDFINQVEMNNMYMRPGPMNPGRTYRFYTGEPVYPFGYGLSYTAWGYTWGDNPTGCGDLAGLQVVVTNTGARAGDHSALWFLVPPNAGQNGRILKKLHEFDRASNVTPGASREFQICVGRNEFELADEEGQFQVVTGNWRVQVGDLERIILVT